jgi:hypothetical protein
MEQTKEERDRLFHYYTESKRYKFIDYQWKNPIATPRIPRPVFDGRKAAMPPIN